MICAAFPFYPAQARIILGVVSLLGLLAGIAFGSSYQLVSRFGNDESVALTTGLSPVLHGTSAVSLAGRVISR